VKIDRRFVERFLLTPIALLPLEFISAIEANFEPLELGECVE
jgi:hypothetical protein